jgi:hypothetical protein
MSETQEQVQSKITYFKCSHCGVVTSEGWKENEAPENGPIGFLICPVCEKVNAEGREDNGEILVATHREIVAPFTKADLDELDRVKKEIKALDKQEEKLVPKIKPFLVQNNITQFEFEGHKMAVAYQNRGSMDEEALLAILDSKLAMLEFLEREEGDDIDDKKEAYNSAIVVQRKTNPDAVKKLLVDGLLSIEELATCMKPNIVPVFYLNAKPKKEKAAPSGFGGMF